MTRHASRFIAALLPDGGAEALREAGLGATWEAVLAQVPPAVLELPEGTRARGASLLVRCREHWARKGELRPAVAATRALYRLKVDRLGADHSDTLVELSTLGQLAHRAGRGEAQIMLEDAWRGLRSGAGGRDIRLAIAAANLGAFYLATGDLVRAEDRYEQAWRIRRQARKGVGPISGRLAEVRLRRGNIQGAVPLLFEAWQRERAANGPDDPRTMARSRLLTRVLLRLERYDSAATVLREQYNADRARGDVEATAGSGHDLGVALDAIGRREEGFRLVEDSVRQTRGLGGPHPELPVRLTTLSRLVYGRGHREEAEGLVREALEAERVLYGDDSVEVALRYAALGRLCIRTERATEGIGWLEPAASLLAAHHGARDPLTVAVVEQLVDVLVTEAEAARSRRDRPYARELLGRAMVYAGSVLSYDHPLMVRADRADPDRH